MLAAQKALFFDRLRYNEIVKTECKKKNLHKNNVRFHFVLHKSHSHNYVRQLSPQLSNWCSHIRQINECKSQRNHFLVTLPTSIPTYFTSFANWTSFSVQNFGYCVMCWTVSVETLALPWVMKWSPLTGAPCLAMVLPYWYWYRVKLMVITLRWRGVQFLDE